MDERPIVTVDDIKKAAWTKGATARTKDSTVRLSECLINGVTVRGSVQQWTDGRREVVYAAHGQTVDSLEALAALLTGRWVAGDDAAARDD